MMGNMGFNATALRKYTTIEKINHVHHAGNSSGIVDGAALVLIGSKEAGEKAGLKAVYRVALSQLVPAKLGEDLPVVTKELVRDLIPDLKAQNGYVLDKVESLAIDSEGTAYVITDNDGVSDSSGETFLWTFKAE